MSFKKKTTMMSIFLIVALVLLQSLQSQSKGVPDEFYDKIKIILVEKYKIDETKAKCIQDDLVAVGIMGKINNYDRNQSEIDNDLKPFYYDSEKKCVDEGVNPEELTFKQSTFEPQKPIETMETSAFWLIARISFGLFGVMALLLVVVFYGETRKKRCKRKRKRNLELKQQSEARMAKEERLSDSDSS